MENDVKEKLARAGLPVPPPPLLAHGRRVEERIRQAIERCGGRLPFDRFMDLALYAPGLGYYSAGTRKFGPEGDFVTAPELSPLFSRCLGRQCAEILSQTGGDILEFGAGSGIMAAGLLRELAARDALPGRYLILDVSADLRERQRETIEREVPRLLDRVTWIDETPAEFTGVVLANEVLDAMPVQRFVIEAGGVRELCVAWAGCFEWVAAEPDPALAGRAERLRREYALPEGYVSEVSRRAEAWVDSVGAFLRQGAALLIDYGFPAAEFYHPQRSEGTLMCHYRQRSHSDPFLLVGLQDITAHVDFTAVAERALTAGLSVKGFTNQANFLLGNGLLDFAAGESGAVRQAEAAAQVKRLVLPGEMGELFKVLAVGRGLDGPLSGFSLRDDRARLG